MSGNVSEIQRAAATGSRNVSRLQKAAQEQGLKVGLRASTILLNIYVSHISGPSLKHRPTATNDALAARRGAGPRPSPPAGSYVSARISAPPASGAGRCRW